ncbi:hypothetical protein GCK72_011320 [Caenorhabditis remanei]|uniref:RING-type domain-containing protein n=1 Tax=Caenorhabditis remanei TaxID=31234 RepID=A0A6A5H7F9_CAERE|nr:hypothetical protein GCK72_011320 [Caenorhabditis remanei]KAF1763055.1 hypothetical protein GCK72_011320 [Caenorhabditis remanei]
MYTVTVSVAGLCLEGIRYVHRILKGNEVKRCKNELLIGYMAVILWAMRSRYLLFYSGYDKKVEISATYRSLVEQEQEPEIQDDGQNEEDHSLEAPHELLRNMEQLMKTPSGYECKICLVEYSTTRIPRMLSACGHTVCEKCAGQLLEHSVSRAVSFSMSMWIIQCPFCREVYAFFGEILLCGLVFEIDKAKLHKIELLIGNGVAILCPIVPTFLMRSLKIDEKEMYLTQFILLGSALVFFYLPYLRSSHYNLPTPFRKIHKLLLVTHGAIIYFLVENQKADGICFMQAVMWLLSFVGIHEFWSIYRTDLRLCQNFAKDNYPILVIDYNGKLHVAERLVDLKDRPTQGTQNFIDRLFARTSASTPARLPVAPEAPPAQDTQNLVRQQLRLECNICLEDYSKTRVPRILKECGHSICDVCVGRLQNIVDNFLFVICPTCQRSTYTIGSELPKNYALIELMEKLGH